jgi:DNA-binding MarR family transcriptional regulator
MVLLKGNIGEFSLSEVFHIVSFSRNTGSLVIEGSRSSVSIYFVTGRAVFANPIYSGDSIGKVLVKNGIINKTDFREALTRQKELGNNGSQVRVGSILVSMGILTDRKFSDCLIELVRETIYDILTDDRARFEFLREKVGLTDYAAIGIDIEEIIHECERRLKDWELIQDASINFDNVYSISPDPLEDNFVQISVSEWKILSLVDGYRTVRDIIEISRLNKFEVCKTVHTLLELGLIDKKRGKADSLMKRIRKVRRRETNRGVIRKLIDRVRRL